MSGVERAAIAALRSAAVKVESIGSPAVRDVDAPIAEARGLLEPFGGTDLVRWRIEDIDGLQGHLLLADGSTDEVVPHAHTVANDLRRSADALEGRGGWDDFVARQQAMATSGNLDERRAATGG